MLASIVCGTILVFFFVNAWAQTQLLLLIDCTLLSPKTPGFNFAKVKTVPSVCLRKPSPLFQPLPGFSHQIPCMALGLTVGSVSKIRTLTSSEIHDGLGSWHGGERPRPQWLSPPCSSLCASCLEEGSSPNRALDLTGLSFQTTAQPHQKYQGHPKPS